MNEPQSDRTPNDDQHEHTMNDQQGQESRAGSPHDSEPPPAPRTGGTYETAAGHYPAPPGVHEAPSSIWPMVVAGAIAFTLFGIITRYPLSLFGIVVFIVGIVGWVGELLSE